MYFSLPKSWWGRLQHYIGDLIMVRVLRYWWQNHYAGDTNIPKLSSTLIVSNIRHQQRFSRQEVTFEKGTNCKWKTCVRIMHLLSWSSWYRQHLVLWSALFDRTSPRRIVPMSNRFNFLVEVKLEGVQSSLQNVERIIST